MESSWSDAFLASKRNFWFVSILAIVLFAITDLPWQLDDYDQAKQAFTSFEIVQEGHWLYQRTPNESVATKPPLIGWMSAATFAITRSWEISWRLPSLAAAVIMFALLARAAGAAYGGPGALIAMSAFGLNLLSPRLATLVRTDMPLALVIFLIGLQIWAKIRKREVWRPRDRVIQFALLTAAMLIKGPIVHAFLLPGIALFQWRTRKSGAGMTAWCGWWPWIASLSVFLLWSVGGIIFIPEFYERVVLHEFLGRFGETMHRPQPIYFYLPHLVHKFAPWSVLLIAGVFVELRSAKWRIREVVREMPPETFWLLAWSLGGLVVMSLIPSKRVDRIFPVVPPLCLLLAAQFSRTPSEKSQVRRWFAAAIILACAFSGGYSAAKIVNGYRVHRGALADFGRRVREEAAAHHWRYEVIGRRDEGMLLYLRRLHFIQPERAVAEWNAGTLDALIVPEKDAPDMLRRLRGASVVESLSVPGDHLQLDYALLTRQ